MPQILNALSVDVEDYFQVSGFERDVSRTDWDSFPSRVVANTQRLLDLLARHGARGTFFVLGWTAERYPQLVREIRRAGHELGSHSYWHRLIYELSPHEFREDLRRSRQVIEDAIGERVALHRAPSFSITKRSLWALEILAEEGFRVDSSVFPVYHDRYGIPGANPNIHSIETPAGALWEFPPSVVRMGPLHIPVSGGGYFRLYPLSLTARLLASVNSREMRPFVFYVHPWEVDPEQPRLRAGSRLSRLRHYLNLTATEGKLEGLLSRFALGPLSEVIDQAIPVGCRAKPQRLDSVLPVAGSPTCSD